MRRPQAVALGDVRLATRFGTELLSFLRTPLDLAGSRRLLREGVSLREQRLLDVLTRDVFARPAHPYARLMRNAGIELGDATRLVRDRGVDAALGQLHDAGVFVALDELRGQRPIVRGGLELEVAPSDFRRPLDSASGVRVPATFDLDLLAHEAAHHAVFLDAFQLANRPTALWMLAGPAASGLKNVLRHAKLGLPVQRWFSPRPLRPKRGATTAVLFTTYAVAASRFVGRRLPWPEYVPFSDPGRVARWLAETQAGVLWTNVSAAVRVCRAAVAHGLDLSGTTFRVGGEPLTAAKAEIIAAAGSSAVCHYSMHEVGKIGIACAEPKAIDDVHLLTDKIAALERPTHVGTNGKEVRALFHTTLLPSSPTFFLNVESGDQGTISERECGCAFGRLGFTKHAQSLSSYEKLTSEGNTFYGSGLVELLDSVLPARFGGAPTDYQLVEQEVDGLTQVTLLVSPAVGRVDEDAVLGTVIDCLSQNGAAGTLMAELWRDARTLRVSRRDPIASTSMKVLPLRNETGRA